MKNLTDSGHGEGKVAEAIEEQAAKLSSDLFLWTSLGAMGVSLARGMTSRATKPLLNFNNLI